MSDPLMSRRERRVEFLLMILPATVLLYVGAGWAGLTEEGYQPARLAVLGFALLLQPAAALIRHRSRLLFHALLAVSLSLVAVAIWWSR